MPLEHIGRFTIKDDCEFGDSLPLTIWDGKVPIVAIVGDNMPEDPASDAAWTKARSIAHMLNGAA